jgi:hypothetical protein
VSDDVTIEIDLETVQKPEEAQVAAAKEATATEQ